MAAWTIGTWTGGLAGSPTAHSVAQGLPAGKGSLMIDLNAFGHELAWAGCFFLLAWWLLVSRRVVGLIWTVVGWLAILVAVQYVDHHLTRLVGVAALVLVLGGLVAVLWALARNRSRNRFHVLSDRDRAQYMARIEKSQARAKKVATQAERLAAEVPVGPRPPRRAVAPSATPGQKRVVRKRVARSRGAYVINRGKSGAHV